MITSRGSPFRAGQQDAAQASIARLLTAARSSSELDGRGRKGNESDLADAEKVKAGP